MNWDSCEVPKNSLIDATTGRMLIRVCGVIASTSWVVIRSRTTRSMRERPTRIWFWISSPTVRRRRLPKWSMSSVPWSGSPAWRRTTYSMVATMSSSVSVPLLIGTASSSFLLNLYRPTFATSYRFGLKKRLSSRVWAFSLVGGSPGRSLR